MRYLQHFVLIGLFLGNCLGNTQVANASAPTGKAYDVLSRLFQPFIEVLLTGGKRPDRAMELEMRIVQVKGRLPSQIVGATLHGWIQNPDKIRLEAPVAGELFTVVRNGNEVWASPGEQIELLLNQFKDLPQPLKKNNTPFAIPFTAQQAVFLMVLFDIENRDIADIDVLNGVECRILTARLQPDLAKSLQANDFKAAVWIDAAYTLKRLEISRRDFQMVIDLTKVQFFPALPVSTWQPPTDAVNLYRTNAEALEALLYVVVNSLQSNLKVKP